MTTGDVGIGFSNDAFDPSIGLDRNLLVDRIVVDGVTAQTEDPSTFSTGIYRDGLTGPGFFETELFNIMRSLLTQIQHRRNRPAQPTASNLML